LQAVVADARAGEVQQLEVFQRLKVSQAIAGNGRVDQPQVR
jgi:hypothetical protein